MINDDENPEKSQLMRRPKPLGIEITEGGVWLSELSFGLQRQW